MAYVLEQFVGGAYGWMWPFRSRVAKWYSDVVRELDRAACVDVRK